MSVPESVAVLRERELLEQLIERPELVDGLPRTKLPAVMNHAAAVQAKAAALQSRIAARLLREPEQQVSEEGNRLIRADEAAKRLGYRVQYLYQLIREHRFPAHREGRKIRIGVGDLNAWIREHSQNPVDAGEYFTYSSHYDGKRPEIDPEVLGSTQAEFAALVGVAPNSIARQERGEMGIREPLARLVRLIAKQMTVEKEKGKRRGKKS